MANGKPPGSRTVEMTSPTAADRAEPRSLAAWAAGPRRIRPRRFAVEVPGLRFVFYGRMSTGLPEPGLVVVVAAGPRRGADRLARPDRGRSSSTRVHRGVCRGVIGRRPDGCSRQSPTPQQFARIARHVVLRVRGLEPRASSLEPRADYIRRCLRSPAAAAQPGSVQVTTMCWVSVVCPVGRRSS